MRKEIVEILNNNRLKVIEETLKSDKAMYDYLNNGCIDIEPFRGREEIYRLGYYGFIGH